MAKLEKIYSLVPSFPGAEGEGERAKRQRGGGGGRRRLVWTPRIPFYSHYYGNDTEKPKNVRLL